MSSHLYKYKINKLLKVSKYLSLNIFFVSSLFATETNYIGCGTDDISARDELAKSIYINVKSSFEKSEVLSGDKAIKNLSNISNQTTNLILTGIKINKDGDKTCATISSDDLKKSLTSAKIEIKDFNLSMLSGSSEEKRAKLLQKIGLCESGLKLASLFGDGEAGTIFQNKLAEFQKIVDDDNFQNIKFNIENGSNLQIFIDGDKKSYKINEEISVSTGNHQYLISGDLICNIAGNFSIEQNKNILINDINIKDYIRPQITFSTNQENKFVKLNVDGDEVAINREISLKKCSGNVPYSASYNDGTYTNTAIGIVEKIEPNMNKTIHIPFLSIGDVKAIQNEASTYLSGTRLEFLYSYSISSPDKLQANEEFKKDTHNIELNFINQRRLFRYGIGMLYGNDKDSKWETEIAELYYLVAIQFASFGQYDLPPRVGSFSFIPYIGIKLGIAYHQYSLEDGTTIWNHPEDGDDDFDYKPEDYENDFERDSLLIKPIVGIDFILSKGFAWKIFIEQNQKIDKRIFFGTGLTVEF